MSVQVRPPVKSLLLFLCIAACLITKPAIVKAESTDDPNAIVGIQFVGGQGHSNWGQRLRDPYLEHLQNQVLSRSIETQNLNRTFLELYQKKHRKPKVSSSSGRISFLASSESWYAVGFSAIGSYSTAQNLPQANATTYYDYLLRHNINFISADSSQQYLAELQYNLQKSRLSLPPNFMLSLDWWIRPKSWYVQPFLRLGVSAPVEQNYGNGLLSGSSGLQIALAPDQSVQLIVEAYADYFNVLWDDYTELKKSALVWDTGWRAGFSFGL